MKMKHTYNATCAGILTIFALLFSQFSLAGGSNQGGNFADCTDALPVVNGLKTAVAEYTTLAEREAKAAGRDSIVKQLMTEYGPGNPNVEKFIDALNKDIVCSPQKTATEKNASGEDEEKSLDYYPATNQLALLKRFFTDKIKDDKMKSLMVVIHEASHAAGLGLDSKSDYEESRQFAEELSQYVWRELYEKDNLREVTNTLFGVGCGNEGTIDERIKQCRHMANMDHSYIARFKKPMRLNTIEIVTERLKLPKTLRLNSVKNTDAAASIAGFRDKKSKMVWFTGVFSAISTGQNLYNYSVENKIDHSAFEALCQSVGQAINLNLRLPRANEMDVISQSLQSKLNSIDSTLGVNIVNFWLSNNANVAHSVQVAPLADGSFYNANGQVLSADQLPFNEFGSVGKTRFYNFKTFCVPAQ